MINPYKGSGIAHAHNFRNRYLDDAELQKPSQYAADKLYSKTKDKVNDIIGIKTEAAHGTYLNRMRNDNSEIVSFTSKTNAYGDLYKQRIVKIQNVQMDPFLPPRYKHRKVPRGPASPPPQVLRSPPRQLTQEDMKNWSVPPCISNWRNPNGYTIPLHMRLSADGRTLQHNTINERFADIIDSIHIAERQARSELEERAKIEKSVNYKNYIKKYEYLRSAAIRAREERNRLIEEAGNESEEDYIREREEIRNIRAKELEREERLNAIGARKKKEVRDKERDISYKVALGQAQPTNNELIHDYRLFNNSSGLGAGLLHDDDDNVYDKPLFADRSAVNMHKYRDRPDDDEEGEVKNDMRSEPVRFVKHKDDVFGLGDFVTKKQKKE